MQPQLSIVATMYCSSRFVAEFVARAVTAAAQVCERFEIILVNDGCPEDSLATAIRIADQEPRVCVVDLARNFGHHRAMMLGLEHARGERVLLIDVDLEEAPELLTDFWSILNANPDADVAYGQLLRRRGGWFERLSGAVFYALINRLSGVNLPRNVVTARLMTRRYVRALLEYREREIFLAGLWHITGFRQLPVQVTKHYKGETTYGLRRKLSILVTSITSFSDRPLRYIFYSGIVISALSGGYALYLVYVRLFTSDPPSGWASLIVSVWFLGGMVILYLGIIGIYLAKVFTEVKQRPYGTVRTVYRGGSAHGN